MTGGFYNCRESHQAAHADPCVTSYQRVANTVFVMFIGIDTHAVSCNGRRIRQTEAADKRACLDHLWQI